MTPEAFEQHRRNLAAVERASAEVAKTTEKLCSLAVSIYVAQQPASVNLRVALVSRLGERLVDEGT